MSFVLCYRRGLKLCRVYNSAHSIRKSGRWLYSNAFLEGPLYSRLASLLQTPHQSTDGLGISENSLETLNHARCQLIERIGVENQAGIAPETIAANTMEYYKSLEEVRDGKKLFLSVIASLLGVNHTSVVDKARQLVQLQHQQRSESTLLMSESGLRHSLTPFYSELFSVVARVEGGIKFLVDLRADLLDILKSRQPKSASTYLLSELDTRLKETLSEWFTPQLMELQNITWQSPCDILEKISEYEAVHRFRHWRHLKHRVGVNRKCFIFTHKAIHREPIVVLHVALTSGLSNSIQELLDINLSEDRENVRNAVFYSIFTTHKGLSGVELGNFLIRRAVDQLQRDYPNKLNNFVTLSPIPGFKKWLDGYMNGEHGLSTPVSQAVREAVANNRWMTHPEVPFIETVKQPLLSLCARYLASEKRRGYALDPVAHFHLSNGASIWRVNWLGDSSVRGHERSLGFMVNYRYHLPDISTNSDSYRLHGSVASSHYISQYLQ